MTRRAVDGPALTAAVCALNEAATVGGALESLLQQSLPPGSYEILAIDNGSGDDTARVMDELAARHPGRIRPLREAALGLNLARNRALREARAPLVAFLDADALADPSWLEALLEAFEDNPSAAVVGGPVEIRWDHPRPRWWDARLDEALNHYRPAPDGLTLRYPRYPYGTNFAVRGDAARAAGGFRPGFDRRGRQLMGAGEGELCFRLERGGHAILYAPRALVHHRTAASRLTRRYVLRRAFMHGRSQRRLEAVNGFESGMYPSWPRLALLTALALARFGCNLPFLKFLLFRAGFCWERSFGGRRREAPARLAPLQA